MGVEAKCRLIFLISVLLDAVALRIVTKNRINANVKIKKNLVFLLEKILFSLFSFQFLGFLLRF
jgi:hypothetical protein